MARSVVVRVSLVKKAAERPRRYQVLLLDEPRPQAEAALRVLRAVFRKTASEALHLLDLARRTGTALVAEYTQEVAETKVQIAADFTARIRQRVTFRVEPAE